MKWCSAANQLPVTVSRDFPPLFDDTPTITSATMTWSFFQHDDVHLYSSSALMLKRNKPRTARPIRTLAVSVLPLVSHSELCPTAQTDERTDSRPIFYALAARRGQRYNWNDSKVIVEARTSSSSEWRLATTALVFYVASSLLIIIETWRMLLRIPLLSSPFR